MPAPRRAAPGRVRRALQRVETALLGWPITVYYAIAFVSLVVFAILLWRTEALNRAVEDASVPRPTPAVVTVTPTPAPPSLTVERIDTTSNGARIVWVRTASGDLMGMSTVVQPGDGITVTRPTPTATPSK